MLQINCSNCAFGLSFCLYIFQYTVIKANRPYLDILIPFHSLKQYFLFVFFFFGGGCGVLYVSLVFLLFPPPVCVLTRVVMVCATGENIFCGLSDHKTDK